MRTTIKNEELTIKEKIVIRLILFVIQLLKPYEYEHQFKNWFQEMKELMNETIEKKEPVKKPITK